MLDVNPLLLLFTAVTFLALLVYLNKTMYRPLLGFMKNRDDVIRKDREHASKNESDIGAYEKEANAIISEAKAEIIKERSLEIAKVKDEINKTIEAKRVELEADHEVFQKKLNEEAKELKEALRAQMPLFKEGIRVKLNQI